jgi:hypothetical protein
MVRARPEQCVCDLIITVSYSLGSHLNWLQMIVNQRMASLAASQPHSVDERIIQCPLGRLKGIALWADKDRVAGSVLRSA